MITFNGQKLEAFGKLDAFDFFNDIPGKAPAQKILKVFAEYEREWNQKCDPENHQEYFRGRTFYMNGGVPHIYKSGIVFSLEGDSMDHYFISTVGMAEAFISGVKWKEGKLKKFPEDHVGTEDEDAHGHISVKMKNNGKFSVMEETTGSAKSVISFDAEPEAQAFAAGAYAGYGGTSALMSEELLKEANDFS